MLEELFFGHPSDAMWKLEREWFPQAMHPAFGLFENPCASVHSGICSPPLPILTAMGLIPGGSTDETGAAKCQSLCVENIASLQDTRVAHV
jgi:hypothetical protein